MEEFFGSPTIQDVAQVHIAEVRKLEEQEAIRILKRYREIRQELRDRLDTLPPGTFKAQQMRSVLVQIELAINEIVKSLKEGIGGGAQTMAEEGINHLIEEIQKWNKKFTGAIIPINLDAVRVATDTRNFLFNRYDSSLEAYGSQLTAVFASEITNAVIEQLPTADLVQRLAQKTMEEEWKLLRLVRTELHNIYNIGKLDGMRELKEEDIPDLKKALMHPMDHRTGEDSKKLAVLNPIIPIDEPFEYEWQGEIRRFMAPPDRPNDRAILVPFREGWREPGGFVPLNRKKS